MASEINMVAETAAGFAASEKSTENQLQDSATDVLQENSIWQTYEPSGYVSRQPAIDDVFQPPDQPALTPALSAEERAILVDKLDSRIDQQLSFHNLDLAALAVMGLGLAATRYSKPAALVLGGLGVGGSLVSQNASENAHHSAQELLSQMPAEDRELFGKYENAVHASRELTSAGYLISGGLGLVSMSGLSKFVNPKVYGAAFLGALTNNLYQSQIAAPSTVKNFRDEVSNWKNGLILDLQ